MFSRSLFVVHFALFVVRCSFCVVRCSSLLRSLLVARCSLCFVVCWLLFIQSLFVAQASRDADNNKKEGEDEVTEEEAGESTAPAEGETEPE